MCPVKFFRTSVLLAIVLIAGSNLFAGSANTINLPDPAVSTIIVDDTIPSVTARVARISFIRGEVQVKRFGADEWEVATLNLPIVEGDEITTLDNARLEIQFDKQSYLRIEENSNVKISKLFDEGIALSLPNGTLSLRVNEYDANNSYYEIDGPGTTVAIQRSGTYRIDAEDTQGSNIRVSVTEGGEARIYSDNSGFTLKNGRSSQLFLAGNRSGEWETGDADLFTDEFDSWAIQRDALIAKAIKSAYYDKYYDQDIYGAEDLSDAGSWSYLSDYGYVWRPYQASTNRYANWSPYRYGQWRWVPPYGWTWINDEPWGWATYHHGRWFHDRGHWYWSPYGHYRRSRSWWAPALVVMTAYAGNICWYPLPYSYNYYNYNYYYNYTNYNIRHGGNNGGGTGPVPSPTPVVNPEVIIPEPRGPRPPLGTVPTTGVITVKSDEFGKNKKGIGRPPLSVANDVLSKVPDEKTSLPRLPVFSEIKGQVSPDIIAIRPTSVKTESNVKTGVIRRTSDAPLDTELRNKKMLGGRTPIETKTEPAVVRGEVPTGINPTKTGAVTRPPTVKQEVPVFTVKQPPRNDPPKQDVPQQSPPIRPQYNPPQKQEKPRYDPPPAKQPPRSEPPPATQPPKSEPKPKSQSPSESRPGNTKKPDNLN